MKNWLLLKIIILTLGFILSPTWSYAFGSKTESSCCKKESAEKTEKTNCCNKMNSKENNNTCNGKCGYLDCTIITANLNINSISEINFKNNNFDFSIEKPKFHHLKTFILSGFTTVWLPPKIG